MQANRWRTVEKVFNQSVALPAEKRGAFVASACAGDADLIEDVLTLLAEADKDNSFLSDPVFEVGTKILASEYVGLFDEPNFAAYEMQKILGRGGSGVVFLAKDIALERNIAIKVLPASLADDDERIVRFRQEAKAASAISHPNIAHIYGFGKADGRYYLTMEYVEGNTLRELLKKKKIDRLFAVEIACQMANALTAAHKAGIVHRDIKPENVAVTDDRLVKILDFGLAKPFVKQNPENNQSIHDSFDTKPGMIFGTAAYMSPEQIRGQSLDWRTDVWSLGVVLYEMLVGKRPFAGDTQSDIQAQILSTEPEYPNEIAQIPEIKNIFDKTLAKNVNSRYEETSELANDLEIVYKYLTDAANNNKYSFAAFGAANPVESDETENRENDRDAKSEKLGIGCKILIAAAILLIFIIILVNLSH